MTPHHVISLLTQQQTFELLVVCVQFLPVDRIECALREGCDELERRQLAFQLSIEFDTEDMQDSESP